jgi:dihydroxyacetone kinase-like protein
MMAAETRAPAHNDGRPALLLDAVCASLIEGEAEFNALDRAIGDGDHGSNLVRAARQLADLRHELVTLAPGEALIRAGRAIMMGVGGASGPLYGTLLMETGKALPENPAPVDWARAFSAGVEGMARRGRSQEGDKTMLDVLAPASRGFSANAAQGLLPALVAMLDGAREGFGAQRGLRARRGRAAYVGDRSIGQDDPGAASALHCLTVIAAVLRENGR